MARAEAGPPNMTKTYDAVYRSSESGNLNNPTMNAEIATRGCEREPLGSLGALSRFDKLKAPSLSRGLSNGSRFFSDRNATRASRPQQDRCFRTRQSS